MTLNISNGMVSKLIKIVPLYRSGTDYPGSLTFEVVHNDSEVLMTEDTKSNYQRVLFDINDLIELGKYLEEVRNKSERVNNEEKSI